MPIGHVDVVAVRALGDYRVWVQFSNGREGVRDFADMIAEGGPVVEPLKDKLSANLCPPFRPGVAYRL